MKVIVINGSPRKEGNTAILIQTVFNTDFRQPFMFHQKIHNFLSKPDDQYYFLKNISL